MANDPRGPDDDATEVRFVSQEVFDLVLFFLGLMRAAMASEPLGPQDGPAWGTDVLGAAVRPAEMNDYTLFLSRNAPGGNARRALGSSILHIEWVSETVPLALDTALQQACLEEGRLQGAVGVYAFFMVLVEKSVQEALNIPQHRVPIAMRPAVRNLRQRFRHPLQALFSNGQVRVGRQLGAEASPMQLLKFNESGGDDRVEAQP